MRRLLLFASPLLLTVPLAAASGPAISVSESVAQRLQHARTEAAQAEKRMAALEGQAEQARDEAGRLAAEQQAAAAAIDAAEARIGAADAALDQARAEVARREAALAQRRAPVAALLAGMATMGRRPPLLALADGTSVDEIVRIRALLDSTTPIIRARSAALAADVEQGRKLTERATLARRSLDEARKELAQRRQRFAALEEKAAARALALSGQSFEEGDRALAGTEAVSELGSAATADSQARANARRLAQLGMAPPRPFAPEGQKPAQPPFAYRLPLTAPVVDGLGAVSPAGVRARGIRFDARRGMPVVVPASGTVLFAGPYRSHDGIVIIDHGQRWTSLFLGVAANVRSGSKVRAGDPLGSALGEVTVELRDKSGPQSAALIAGSSGKLSNGLRTR